METQPLLPEDLTRLRPFVRALVADEASADDILQETWLRSRAGLRRDQGAAAARSWARRTAERLVWSRARSERSRASRERHAAAERGATPGPSEQLAAIELLRNVLAKLAELPVADRQAVTLRYLGGESARTIAARLGVSEEAARQRVHRALKRLRAELDAEHGDARAGWAGPLLGLVGSTGAGTLLGPLAKLAAAASLLASVGIGLALAADLGAPDGERRIPDAAAALELPELQAATGPISATALPQGPARAPIATHPDPAPMEAAASGHTGSFEVTLLESPDDTPLAGVEVWWLASADNPLRGSALTDGQGRLQLPFLPTAHWHVGLALQPAGHALHSPSWQGHEGLARLVADPVLRFERGILLGGVLCDTAREPVADAQVSIPRLRPSYGMAGNWWPDDLGWWTRTRADGSFSIWAHDLACDLELYHSDYGLLQLASDARPGAFEALGRGAANLVLPRGPAYSGRVTDTTGAGLAAVEVALVQQLNHRQRLATRTDSDGRFRLAEFTGRWISTADVAPQLLIRKPGYRGVALAARTGNAQEPVALAAAPALRIRVVDGQGRPLPGAQVQVREAGFDPTKGEPYSDLQPQITGSDAIAQFESVLEGPYQLVLSADGFESAFRTMDTVPAEAVEVQLVPAVCIDLRLRAPGAEEPIAPDSVVVDDVKDGEPRSWRPFVQPLEQGFFRIVEVFPSLGEFTVRVQVEGFRAIELGPLTREQGSQRIERLLEPAEPALEGLLLDHRGEPLAGVAIAALAGPFERLWTNRSLQLDLHRQGTRTGPDGRFQIPEASSSDVLVAEPRDGFAFCTVPEFQRNRGVLRARPLTSAYLGRLPHSDEAPYTLLPTPDTAISNPALRFAFVATSPGHEQPDARMIFPGARQSAGGGVLFLAVPCGPSELLWGPAPGPEDSSGARTSPLSLVAPIGAPQPLYKAHAAAADARFDPAPLRGLGGSRRFDLAEGERLELAWEL